LKLSLPRRPGFVIQKGRNKIGKRYVIFGDFVEDFDDQITLGTGAAKAPTVPGADTAEEEVVGLKEIKDDEIWEVFFAIEAYDVDATVNDQPQIPMDPREPGLATTTPQSMEVYFNFATEFTRIPPTGGAGTGAAGRVGLTAWEYPIGNPKDGKQFVLYLERQDTQSVNLVFAGYNRPESTLDIVQRLKVHGYRYKKQVTNAEQPDYTVVPQYNKTAFQ